MRHYPKVRPARDTSQEMSRAADRPDPVPDEIWAEAAEHFTEQELAAIVLTIGTVNLWNRLHIAIGQVANPNT